MQHFVSIHKRNHAYVGFIGADIDPLNNKGKVGKRGIDKNFTLEKLIELAYEVDANIIIKSGPNAKWYLKKFPIHDIENEIPDVNFSVSDLLSKSLAKSLAIKNGKKLERQEQEYIVNTLFFCKEPAVSPSNKSIFITIKVDELDKKFNQK